MKILRAGSLTTEYRGGSVRYIRCGDAEVLRQIYVAVRDQHWNTVPARIFDERITEEAHRFLIEFSAQHVSGEINFVWEGRIEGMESSKIRFSMTGQPRAEFLKNRIGICVLHPVTGVAGEPCTIEHSDGIREVSSFPFWISPHQPFLDVRGMSHYPQPGVSCELRFAGDLFETEDQRNWTDDSYKTYSTPLALPFPVRVTLSDRMSQAVELSVVGEPKRRAAGAAPVVEIQSKSQFRYALPAIGCCEGGNGSVAVLCCAPLVTRK